MKETKKKMTTRAYLHYITNLNATQKSLRSKLLDLRNEKAITFENEREESSPAVHSLLYDIAMTGRRIQEINDLKKEKFTFLSKGGIDVGDRVETDIIDSTFVLVPYIGFCDAIGYDKQDSYEADIKSPIGQAIVGKNIGEKCFFSLRDEQKVVTILSVEKNVICNNKESKPMTRTLKEEE